MAVIAKEWLLYLKSIKLKTVVLNSNVIGIWQFSKRYWDKRHMKVGSTCCTS